MVLRALIAAALVAAPPADIGSVAQRLAPARGRVVVAQELDGVSAVAAWARGTRVRAVAYAWSGGRWRPASAHGVTITSLGVGPGDVVGRKPLWIAARFAGGGDGQRVLWLDGRRLVPDSGGSAPTYSTSYTVVRHPRRGVHVVVAYAGGGASARARAWTFRVR